MKLYFDESVELNEDDSKCFATLWTAYIDDEYKCACCGKKFPEGHGTVYLGGHKPDGMHFIYDYTKENRVGNNINYDPYNLPPEDETGGIFKVVVGEEEDDEGMKWLNFCHTCWPKLTNMSPDEIYAKYSNNTVTEDFDDDFDDDYEESESEGTVTIEVDGNLARDFGESLLQELIEARLSGPVTVYSVEINDNTTVVYFEIDDIEDYSIEEAQYDIERAFEDILSEE